MSIVVKLKLRREKKEPFFRRISLFLDVNNSRLHLSQTNYLYNHFKKPRPTEKSHLVTCHGSDKSHLPVPVSPHLTSKFRLIINVADVYIGQRTSVSFLIVQFDN